MSTLPAGRTARITSYNVCYTKLLREALAGDDEVALGFETDARPVAERARDPNVITSARVAVRREDGVAEYFHVQQNRPLLERLAAATNGRYFSLADVVKGLELALDRGHGVEELERLA